LKKQGFSGFRSFSIWWVDPSQQLPSHTVHTPAAGWGRELEEQRWEKAHRSR